MTTEEYRKAELQATKSVHRAVVAQPKIRIKLHKVHASIKIVECTVKRCRDESRKAEVLKKLRLLYLKAARIIKKLRRCRSDIVLARIILAPRLAWKANEFGKFVTAIMPSDFKGDTYLLNRLKEQRRPKKKGAHSGNKKH